MARSIEELVLKLECTDGILFVNRRQFSKMGVYSSMASSTGKTVENLSVPFSLATVTMFINRMESESVSGGFREYVRCVDWFDPDNKGYFYDLVFDSIDYREAEKVHKKLYPEEHVAPTVNDMIYNHIPEILEALGIE